MGHQLTGLRYAFVCFLAIYSSIVFGEPMPEPEYPTITQFKSLDPRRDLIKDPYETTAEFEERKRTAESLGDVSISFYAEIWHGYDADRQVYMVDPCFQKTVINDTNATAKSGVNAMGAEWSWQEVTGDRYAVSAGHAIGSEWSWRKITGDQYAVDGEHCERISIPYELRKARLIRADVLAIAKISLTTQRRHWDPSFADPEWGKSIVDKTSTYTYKGEIDEIYIGISSAGVVVSANLKAERDEVREAKRRVEEAERQELRDTVEKQGFTCPLTKAELSESVGIALNAGNVELYRYLVQCPKPSR